MKLTKKRAKGFLACQYYGGLIREARGVKGGPDLVTAQMGSGDRQPGGAVDTNVDERLSVGVDESLNLP